MILHIESRLVVYAEGNDLPLHVYASALTPIAVPQLNNSEAVTNEVVNAIHENEESLRSATVTMLTNQPPPDLGDLRENKIDNTLLRQMLEALDAGKARILQSRITRSGPNEAAWYCIQVKKL